MQEGEWDERRRSCVVRMDAEDAAEPSAKEEGGGGGAVDGGAPGEAAIERNADACAADVAGPTTDAADLVRATSVGAAVAECVPGCHVCHIRV